LINGEIRVLDPKEMPEGECHRIESPYELEARYSTKRSMGWVGYPRCTLRRVAMRDFPI
jgi:hypothetical protein